MYLSMAKKGTSQYGDHGYVTQWAYHTSCTFDFIFQYSYY